MTLNTAEELRAAQWALVDRIYGGSSCCNGHDDAAQATAAYNANIERARELGLLDTMHCNEIDPSQFQLYSDCVKEDDGCRPRGHVTRAEVERYFAERCT